MKKIILFCILAISLLLITACKKTVEEPVIEEPVIEEPVVEEPVIEEPAEPQLTGESDVVETITPGLEIISGARCLNAHIEAVLTNPTEETLTIGKDAKIIINGLLSAYPVCDSNTIAPGESVYCEDITGPLTVRKGQLVKIQVNMKTERSVSIVDCRDEAEE